MQGGNRPAFVTKLAVVVVFDNVAPRLFICPAQKFLTAGDGHDESQRKLVARRDVADIGVRACQRLCIKRIIVQRDVNDIITVGEDNLTGTRVTRVFHCHWRATLKDEAEHLQKMVKPCADNDIFRRALYAAGAAEIAGDSLTQTIVAEMFSGNKIIGRVDLIFAKRFPYGIGKVLGVNHIRIKIKEPCLLRYGRSRHGNDRSCI